MHTDPLTSDLMTCARNCGEQAGGAQAQRYAPLNRPICRRYRLIGDRRQAVWLQSLDKLDEAREPARRRGLRASTSPSRPKGDTQELRPLLPYEKWQLAICVRLKAVRSDSQSMVLATPNCSVQCVAEDWPTGGVDGEGEPISRYVLRCHIRRCASPVQYHAQQSGRNRRIRTAPALAPLREDRLLELV